MIRRRVLNPPARTLPIVTAAAAAIVLVTVGWLLAGPLPSPAARGNVPPGSFTPPAASPLLPDAHRLHDMPVVAQVAAIVVGTLISEDLTCIAVGMLIRQGQLSPAVGGLACFLGIYVGDLLFFLLGRLGGRGLLSLRFFTRGVGPERLKAFGAWFDRRPWAAIAMCRVMPGVRVPLYLAVGALTARTKAFFWWTCFFAFVWTPALIALVVLLGDAFVAPFEWFTGGRGWLPIGLGIASMYLVVRLAMLLATAAGREKLLNRVGRLWGRRPTHEAAEPVPPADQGSASKVEPRL